MAFVVIIPARWASTRLPGKMLADLVGKPLIVRTAERACQSNASRVVVATDHAEIAQTLQSHGYETVMTDVELASGTDRLAQAARLL
ncbi:MAG TPA: NTP transferase domain-containing protein, partial [Orrella sp.]